MSTVEERASIKIARSIRTWNIEIDELRHRNRVAPESIRLQYCYDMLAKWTEIRMCDHTFAVITSNEYVRKYRCPKCGLTVD